MLAAHLRNHAKTARMIATLGNLHVSGVGGSKSEPRCFVIGNVRGTCICECKIKTVVPGMNVERGKSNIEPSEFDVECSAFDVGRFPKIFSTIAPSSPT